MLDVKLLRDDPDRVKQGLAKRPEKFPLDELLLLDKQRRDILVQVESDRHQLKKLSEEFGKQLATNKSAEPPANLKTLSNGIGEAEQRLQQLEAQLKYLPNLPHESVPVGDASKNQIVRVVGEKPS